MGTRLTSHVGVNFSAAFSGDVFVWLSSWAAERLSSCRQYGKVTNALFLSLCRFQTSEPSTNETFMLHQVASRGWRSLRSFRPCRVAVAAGAACFWSIWSATISSIYPCFPFHRILASFRRMKRRYIICLLVFFMFNISSIKSFPTGITRTHGNDLPAKTANPNFFDQDAHVRKRSVDSLSSESEQASDINL